MFTLIIDIISYPFLYQKSRRNIRSHGFLSRSSHKHTAKKGIILDRQQYIPALQTRNQARFIARLIIQGGRGYKGISFCSYQEFVRIAFGPFILNLEYRNFRYKRIITQLTLFVKRQTENSTSVFERFTAECRRVDKK